MSNHIRSSDLPDDTLAIRAAQSILLAIPIGFVALVGFALLAAWVAR